MTNFLRFFCKKTAIFNFVVKIFGFWARILIQHTQKHKEEDTLDPVTTPLNTWNSATKT